MSHFEQLAFSTWGAWTVFASVLATQLGVPVPAAPMLLLAGSSAATGLVPFWQVLAAAVTGVFIADCLWFAVGRKYGRRFMHALVRLSLSIDSSIRHARAWLERFGAPVLSVSKFVPGLGLVAPPLVGTTDIGTKVFVVWDLTGALVWAAFWLLAGALFAPQLARLMASVRANGGTLIELLVVVFVLYVTYRWIRRWRFRRWLAAIRITPEELDAMMHSASPPVILDARADAVRRAEPQRIPGAILIDLDSPEKIDASLLARGVVIYCVCPNEATARHIAQRMLRKGITHVHALKGGFDAWVHQGYAVEALPPIESDR
jgi:membrane protein DedA with SNARE-associated domain/rhodanese-related sulfurtransferase